MQYIYFFSRFDSRVYELSTKKHKKQKLRNILILAFTKMSCCNRESFHKFNHFRLGAKDDFLPHEVR